jgi:tetratricopeptide (TPR) repeat protein
MSAKTIRKALGTLQDDPEHAQAWADLTEALGFTAASEPLHPSGGQDDLPPAELGALLEAARSAHEVRREWDAVARIFEMEVSFAHGSPTEHAFQAELARVLDEELFDDARAVPAYRRLLELRPGDAAAEDAIERCERKAQRWSDLVAKYAQEAKEANDPSFKSSLLVSAAETAYRYGLPQLAAAAKESNKKSKKLAQLNEEILSGLKEALEIDPKNRRAGLLLERIYREQGKYEELATAMEQIANEATSKEERVADFVRLARVLSKKLKSPERAIRAYEQVLDVAPGHPEAAGARVGHFTAHEMWDHLVALYEGQLSSQMASQKNPDPGMLVQIGMVNWKMRNKLEAAEPYFERLRKVEPAHPGMLQFFREWCAAKGLQGRLVQVLTDAQRAMSDSPERRQIAADLAKLAEEGENAAKAIEQWRAILRQEPGNAAAREALKRLYRQTSGWNALTDLLRTELEKVAQDDAAARLPILREIAEIYRLHIKSDSALVTVLSQIVALDKEDADAVRELARVYEALGRWRDLLSTQTRLAELEKDTGAKTELYRAVARRWLEQFSNVQNAIEIYEKVFQFAPGDPEALEKLKELYGKRRAYRPLYELLERDSAAMGPGPARRDVWIEMAKLAAERLDRGADAMKLYKRVLEEDPSASGALDALEKQAEREKDFATVAEVLEHRAKVAPDEVQKLVILQKLGAIYAERLHDHKGSLSAWRRVLDLSPGHAKAMRVLRDSYLAVGDYDGLTELYASHKDYEGLVEVLSAAADRSADADVKVELSFRSAAIYINDLKAPERAFRAYERVLSVRPNEARAAAALVPIYERDERWARLPALYEALLGQVAEVEEKHALLSKLAQVTGQHLQDKVASFGYARRDYELDPEREGALLAFEKTARASGEWSSFVESLDARIKAKKIKKDEKRVLRAKLAEVCATELGRVDESVATYKTLVEEDEGDEIAVSTLDRILRAADRRDDLRWLFDLRIGRSKDTQRLELLGEWAVLEEEAFGAPERSVGIYRRMLEVDRQNGPALRALARLLKASGDAAGAVEVLEQERELHEGADRAACEVELAKLYMGPLGKPREALAAGQRALSLVPGAKDALAVVEELLKVGETRAQAAVILEASYADAGNLSRQAEILEVIIATAASKTDRVKLFGRLSDVQEQLGAYDRAFDVVVRVATEFPTELQFWDRLSALANRTQRAQQFVDAIAAVVPPTGETGLPQDVEHDLAERAATLYDEKLGEIDRAQPYLQRILAKEPSNERAFARLKQILTTRERWTDLEELYERTIGATTEASRRAELLTEVALIAEEITGDHPKAMQFYERILEIEPAHEHATRALDMLYVSEGHWSKLADLLKRQLGTATMEEALALRLRLGTIYFSRLSDPTTALDYLEKVLEADVGNRDARELVERCLDVPELRARTAGVLEIVYTARDEVRDLVRVLEIRLEFATATAEQRELLARISELRDERLKDDAGAFAAFAKLVPVDPNDVNARSRLLDIGRRLGAHDRTAEVMTAAAKRAQSPQPKAEILSEVAKIYEDLLHDSARAEGVYREVLEIEPDDTAIALPAARSLERLYGASGKSAELAKILKVEVRLEDGVEPRRELYGRLGELCETVLDDPKGAIEAYTARLTDDPADERALVALDRLYTRTEDWRALVEILRAREKLVTDGVARRALLVRIATTLGEKLTDVSEAIQAYRAIVDDFGPERPVLSALATLYEIADRWTDLAETLEAELSLADTPEDKLAILARLGQVRQVRLANIDGAIEAYRQALQIHPAHPPSRSALEELLANTDARREAAAILRPLYEVDGENTRLLRVLDIEAEYADSTADKLALYAQAASVAEGPLADGGRAFAYALRGLREAVHDAELPSWLARAERLAQLTGSFGDLVELLKTVIPDILGDEVQLDVTLKVAVLARTKLGDRDLAKSYYAKALDLRADDRRALEALESLYEEASDHAALLDIVQRRAEVAEGDAERLALLFKEARLCDETLKDSTNAITVYERILDLLPSEPDQRALDALERLYTSTERWNDLIALYERQIGMDSAPAARKATLHHRLGVVLEKRLQEVDRAFDQYDAALGLDPQHAATIASLEGLMNEREHAARAAEMLEQVYLVRLDWRRVMATLDARLESSQDPEARRLLLRRLAKLHEEQEEDYRAALETTAKLLAQDIADESTWAELERLARVANAEGRLAEIYAGELEKVQHDEVATARLAKRTGELFEGQKDVDRALKFYRRAYAFAPEDNDGSFEAIDRLLRETKRPAERVALYREALEHRTEPKDRLTTLHTIALLEETELNDDDKAIETYRSAIDIDDSDTHSLEALSRLYARRERYRDLADLTRRRAEQSALPEDEAKFRLDLGKLLERRLGETSAAIDEYQAVVEVVADGRSGPAAEAIAALEALVHSAEHKARVVELLRPIYERADDWRHLVGVNAERLTLTTDANERVAILRETARLWEERGGDKTRAFEAVREAFVADPEDGDTRGELDRLGAATKRWDDLASAYEQGAEKAEGLSRRELLQAIAKIHDSKRDDPRRALDAWQRVYKLDETDLEALEEMDSLASLLSDWQTLVWVLGKKAELVVDDEERARTCRRIGEARRDMLDDAPGAIDAYERALELEPQSAATIDNLLDLYEAKNDSTRLVDLYRRRVELCGPEDDERKFELLVLAANRYEQGLSDRREAITLLGEALAVRPGDPVVTKRLDELFTQERMWPELLENLRLQIASATDDATRRTVKKRVGAVLAKELDDPRQALESYREVLDTADDEAIKAIRELGETHDDLRMDAAEALEPVLKSSERWSDLADVYEMRLRAQTEPHERGTTLRSIAAVSETRLGDTKRAEDALLRALTEQPEDPTLHTEIERVAERLGDGGWEKYAAALGERAGALFDANVTSDLFIRLGRASEERLKDDGRAVKAYVQAAEQSGDTSVVLEALDRLLSRLGDANGLAGVLERRIAIESAPNIQAQLYHRLAGLQIREFGEKARGLATLRLAIECDPNHGPSRESIEQMLEGDDLLFDEAFEALEGVYRQLNKPAELAKLYERRVARAKDGRERSRARLDLVRVLETEVQDAAQAQRVLENAVLDDPSDEEALRELERLAALTSGWKEGADALERALHASQELPAGTKSELWVRLAGWRRDKLADVQGAESAFLQALKADSENLETLRSIEALRRAPGRERELVETLRARAKLEGGPFRKEVLREAKTLAETTVGDAVLAEATLRDLLADDENDQWALEELTRLREQAGDHREVVKLLLRRAESGNDEAVALKHRAARTMTDALGDTTGAIALFEEILEQAPTDALAASTLRGLYEKGGQDRELAKLLVHLIDNASTPEQRASLRLDLARLQDTKFQSSKDAADTLRAILDEEPGHAEAVGALSRLFEKTGQDEELADLLRAQIDVARDRGDSGSELALEVRLGEVFETRLKDATRALAAYEAVLEKDPLHRAALEAVARLSEARFDWARVASSLAKLVELATDASGVPVALRLAFARAHLEDGEGVEQALKRALELDPKNLDVRTQLRGLYEKSQKWAELAELLVGDAALVSSSGIDGAAVAATQTQSTPPSGGATNASSPPPGPVLPASVGEQVKLLRRAAEIHITQRKAPADAVPLLERASSLSPHDRELLLQLCDAYSAAGQEREAARVLERVIASFGNKRSKELSLYHHRLGRTLASLGDKDVALAQFDMAFKIDPGSVSVLKDLGVLALETNDLDRAQKTFRALLLQRLDTNTGITKGEVFYYLGEISAKQGDKAKAVQMLERAIENEPSLDRARTKLLELKG